MPGFGNTFNFNHLPGQSSGRLVAIIQCLQQSRIRKIGYVTDSATFGRCKGAVVHVLPLGVQGQLARPSRLFIPAVVPQAVLHTAALSTRLSQIANCGWPLDRHASL